MPYNVIKSQTNCRKTVWQRHQEELVLLVIDRILNLPGAARRQREEERGARLPPWKLAFHYVLVQHALKCLGLRFPAKDHVFIIWPRLFRSHHRLAALDWGGPTRAKPWNENQLAFQCCQKTSCQSLQLRNATPLQRQDLTPTGLALHC